MANFDLYAVLGVPRDADEKAIKSAYRRLAKKYHPDQNGDEGARERFEEIDQAWQILGDHDKRATYDRYGSPTPPEGNGPIQPEGERPFSWGDFTGFGSMPNFTGFKTSTPPTTEDHLTLRVGDVGLLAALIKAYGSPTDGKWEISRPEEDTRNLPESMYRVLRKGGEVSVYRKVIDWKIYDTDRKGEIKYGYQHRGEVKIHPPSTYFHERLFHRDNAHFQDTLVPYSYYPYLQALKAVAEKIGRDHRFDLGEEAARLNHESISQPGTYREADARYQLRPSLNEMLITIQLTDLNARLKTAEGLVRRVDGNRAPEGQFEPGGEQKG